MPHPAITSLPVELHHEVKFYLKHADSICLGLTCKHLNKIYARKRLCSFSQQRFWSMLFDYDDDYTAQQKLFKQWTTRNLVLPRLRKWTERVGNEAWLRDEHANLVAEFIEWEICVGCVSFKAHTDDWKEGLEFEDVMYHNLKFESWAGEDWKVLQGFVSDGEFCESCSSDWEILNVQ